MDPFSELIGESRRIRALRHRLGQLAGRSAGGRRLPPILIQGETGTGKSLVAKALHRSGARAGGPFVDINCAAIPEALLEAELFGYERGAFTSALRPKPGLFVVAHRGTIFLDEVALLPLEVQAKLLKVIEDRTVRRLGGARAEPIDVWVLSATSGDLAASVRNRQFREDLYHRLGVVTLTVPPLRERRGDVMPLAEHFLARACGDYGLPPRRLSGAARDRLLAYPWPGNVRELANAIERATMLSDTAEIAAEALGLPARPGAAADRRRQPGPPVRAAPRLAPSARAAPDTAANARAGGGPPHRFRWERRFVVSVRVVLDRSPATTRSASGRVLDVAIDKILGFGGTVEAVSPKVLDASFGVAAVDEASRLAGHAALAIQAGVERMRQRNQAGETPGIVIHAGHALVAHLGSGTPCMDLDSRDGLAASIDPLAAIVRSGEILVTRAAASLMGRRFDLEAGRPGQPAAPECHRLVGRATDGLRDPAHRAPFVGRDREVEWLGAHAALALQGTGQIVDIVGEPGVGKSRLIQEFVGRMERGPWRVLEATCDGGGRALYHLAGGLLRSYFGVRPADPPDRLRAAIAAGLGARGAGAESLRAPVETLLGVASDDPRWHDLDPDERRRRTHEAVARLVTQEAGRRPLLIAIEDAHWIDAESRTLLDDLASSVTAHPVLAIISSRPEPTGRRTAALRDQLRVDPLPQVVATELLDELMGRDDSLVSLKGQLVEWTAGNPFFLEESVQSLLEGGRLAGLRGAYVLAGDVLRLEVPATVEGLLAHRIDRLGPTDRQVVQIAAVIGREIPSRLLAAVARVSEIPAGELAASVAHLREADLLDARAAGEEIDLVFRHALTHEVARLGVPRSTQTRLHRAILDEIEGLYGEAAPDRVDLLAHHAVGAERWEKVVAYLNQAGHRALASAATQKAARCFEGALEALGNLPDAPPRWVEALDLHLNLRDVLWPLARMPEVLEHLRAADALARRVGDARKQGWAACYLCQYFWAVGDQEGALQAGDRAVAIARELADVALAAESGFYRGIALQALGRLAEAERALSVAVAEVDAALAAGTPFPSRRFGWNGPVIVRRFLAAVLAELGRFADGHQHGEAALRLAEATESPFALVAAATGLGALHLRRGEPGRAIPLLERALALCRAHRLYNWFANAAASLGRAHVAMGRIDEGVALLEEAARLIEQTGVVVNRSLWLTYLGEAYLAAGQVTRAGDVAERALGAARSCRERGNGAWALLLFGEVLARAGQGLNGEAVSRICEALGAAEELGQRPLEVRCHRALGLLLTPRHPGAAARHEARAAEIAAEIGLLPPPPTAH